MLSVLQCLTPPRMSQLARLRSWPVPLFSQPNAASAHRASCQETPPTLLLLLTPHPPTPTPHSCCSEYSAAVSCISLIRSLHTRHKNLIGCSSSSPLRMFLYLCWLALFCVCLFWPTKIFNLATRCLLSSSVRLLLSTFFQHESLKHEWHECYLDF